MSEALRDPRNLRQPRTDVRPCATLGPGSHTVSPVPGLGTRANVAIPEVHPMTSYMKSKLLGILRDIIIPIALFLGFLLLMNAAT